MGEAYKICLPGISMALGLQLNKHKMSATGQIILITKIGCNTICGYKDFPREVLLAVVLNKPQVLHTFASFALIMTCVSGERRGKWGAASVQGAWR